MLRRLAGLFGLDRHSQARRAVSRLLQPFDDAIAAATAKHQPTAWLRQAKTDFIHNRLAAEIGRAPSAWRGPSFAVSAPHGKSPSRLQSSGVFTKINGRG